VDGGRASQPNALGPPPLSSCVRLNEHSSAMKRVWVIGGCFTALIVVTGVLLPMLAKPSNCGGNSAALTACRNICLATRIISSDRGTNLVSLSGLSAEEVLEFQNVAGLSWLHGARLLVRTNGFVLGAGEDKQVIVVCDTAYSNVPQYRFHRAPPTHAVGYSDGNVGLISMAQFHSLNLKSFQDVRDLEQKSRVDQRMQRTAGERVGFN
jgi:hypothetical protein